MSRRIASYRVVTPVFASRLHAAGRRSVTGRRSGRPGCVRVAGGRSVDGGDGARSRSLFLMNSPRRSSFPHERAPRRSTTAYRLRYSATSQTLAHTTAIYTVFLYIYETDPHVLVSLLLLLLLLLLLSSLILLFGVDVRSCFADCTV